MSLERTREVGTVRLTMGTSAARFRASRACGQGSRTGEMFVKHAFWVGLLLLLVAAPASAQEGDGNAEGDVDPSQAPTSDQPAWTAEEAAGEQAPDGWAAEDEQAQQAEGDEAQPATQPTPADAALSDPTAGQTPATVEPTEAEDAATEQQEEEAPQIPWRNSLFMWDHSLNTTALDPGSTITHNPTYVWSFTLMPRWYLNDEMFLRVRQDMSLELTDTDTYTYNREPILADTQLDFVHANLLTLGDFRWQGGARILLPTSIASRANEIYFGTGIFTAAQYTIPDVLAGLVFSGNSSWSHFWSGSNVTSTETNYPCYVNDVGAAQVCSQVGGPSTVSDSIVAGLAASLNPTPELTLSTGFTWLWRVAHGLADARVPVEGAPDGTLTIPDMSKTHLRGLTYYSASASYQFNTWFNLSANFYTFTSQLSSDGSRRNPLWNVDSSLSLTMTVGIDALYSELTGTAEEVTDPNALRRSAQGPRGRQLAASTNRTTMW